LSVTRPKKREKLQRITIAELISYRQTRDKLIERSGEFPVESEIGTLTGYAFLTPFDSAAVYFFKLAICAAMSSAAARSIVGRAASYVDLTG
jgi:hypothetical protein